MPLDMEGVYCWWAACLRTVRLTFEEFLESRTLWNQAVHGSVDDNIFLTWEWLSAWWKHFGDKKRFLAIAAIDDTRILAREHKHELGEYNENCLMAREVKCVCKCGGTNHGAHLKRNVAKLDEFTKSNVDDEAQLYIA